jgi:hypothetical protein
MPEVRNDTAGCPNKLVAEHGSYVTVEPAGYVPEVVHRSIWLGWNLGSEDEWRRKSDAMQYGTSK